MKISLWRKLEHGIDEDVPMIQSSCYYFGGLQNISEKRLGTEIPEIRLWIAVLLDAAKYRDYKFIGNNHKTICNLARLNSDSVLRAFNYIWELEDDSKQK